MVFNMVKLSFNVFSLQAILALGGLRGALGAPLSDYMISKGSLGLRLKIML